MRKISPLDVSNLLNRLFQEEKEKSIYRLKKHLKTKRLYSQCMNLMKSTQIDQKKDLLFQLNHHYQSS